MEYLPVSKYGLFQRPLRNIRAKLDGYNLELDLIPEAVERVITQVPDGADLATKLILGDKARLIVEDKRMLRLTFEGIVMWHVEEEGCNHPAIELPDWKTVPKIGTSVNTWPLLEVTDSTWKAALPDWRNGDNPLVFHYMIISAVTVMHVLAWEPKGEWLPNN